MKRVDQLPFVDICLYRRSPQLLYIPLPKQARFYQLSNSHNAHGTAQSSCDHNIKTIFLSTIYFQSGVQVLRILYLGDREMAFPSSAFCDCNAFKIEFYHQLQIAIQKLRCFTAHRTLHDGIWNSLLQEKMLELGRMTKMIDLSNLFGVE